MTTIVGSINERGYLKGFKRRGYTEPKCLLELVANSLDSIEGDGDIYFHIGIHEIRMSDRGKGMDRAGIKSMFDLHCENHVSEASRGVSGIGAKPALSNLSGDRNMFLLTHKAGGEYLKVIIPWADIHREGRYTGMVEVHPMSPSDVDAFGIRTGTTIVFPYSDTLRTLIHDNFASIDEEDNTLVAPLDRIGIVFGRESTQINYVHHETPCFVNILPKYNYFAATDAEYYTGVKRAVIEHWFSEDGKDRFICEGKEIIRAGRGWSKEPCDRQTNMSGFRRVGEYLVLVGLRRDAAIFDDAHPALPTANHVYQNAYNTEHLGSGNKEYLALSKLVRNGQTIGLIPLADITIANARANGALHCKVELVQCEVRFNPVSAQDNRQDNVMGIQENKNQFDGDSLPLNFTRLVKAIRMQKGDDIWEYFKMRVVAALPPAEEAEAEAEDTEVDEELEEAEEEVEEAEAEEEEETKEEDTEADPEPVMNGNEIRKRMVSIMLKIKSDINYSPAILQQLATLETLFSDALLGGP